MEERKLKSILESILFVHAQPLAIKKLALLTDSSQKEVGQAIGQLKEEYLRNEHGFAILEKDDKIQLVTHPDNGIYIQKIVQGEVNASLSSATLEVLSIVAYRGPLSRSEIEAIRGVNCSYVLRNLLVKGLIERVESEEDTRVFLYKPSFEFLKLLGINSLSELPKYEDLSRDSRVQSVAVPEETKKQ